MAKIEARAVDSGLVAIRGEDETRAIQWWKDRFALLAGIQTDAARAGALVPQFRELASFPEADRRRLTRARMQAFVQVPSDQRQRILAARQLANAIDPALLASDDAVVQQLIPEVPGAEEIQRQLGS